MDIDESFDQKLSALAIKKCCPKAEIIKRALLCYNVLSKYDTDETKISITDKNDNILKDVIFY